MVESTRALDAWVSRLPTWLRGVARRHLGLERLDAIREALISRGAPARFLENALEALQVSCEACSAGLQLVPGTGPVVIAANHPHGMLDGLALAVVVRRVRSDVKVLANSRLSVVPELREHLICVDPYGGAEAISRNRAPMREALEWLSRGGALVVFPAGDVAQFDLRRLRAADSRWGQSAARLAIRTGAQFVPAFIEGRNSLAFQMLGLLHARVRTALLPRELLNKRGRSIRVVFGRPFSSDGRALGGDAELITRYLELRTRMLGFSLRQRGTPGNLTMRSRDELEPVAAETDRELLRREVNSLAQTELVRAGPLRVFCFRAFKAPTLLREVGRLREVTFREVGEGTGKNLDLDEFDDHYLHLVLWDEDRGVVAGAYRLGQTDDILPSFGVRGLYTRTLFRYGRRLLSELGPAIELGRSFVTADYQRSYAPLLLLWKGIARFVRRHPQYRMLFGAVSISAEYDSMTKRLLMAFLRANYFDDARARMVRARRPPSFGHLAKPDLDALSAVAASLDDADQVVRNLDRGGRGIPVLVRQYLQLNAKLLGFNIDAKFGDALDGLFYVDLARVDRRILARYMGAKEASEFLEMHEGRRAVVA